MRQIVWAVKVSRRLPESSGNAAAAINPFEINPVFYRIIGVFGMNDRLRTGSRALWLAAFFLLSAAPVCLAQSSPAARKITTVEGITEYRLDNGLCILLDPDPSTPNVTVDVTVLVGSRHEGYGETGMAHLLEHMQFKGTPNHPAIPKELKARGAEYNANTWYDRTTYFERLPANDDNLEFAIRLEADRLVNSLVRRQDLDSEMTVVRNEFEMGENSPSAILNQRMMGVAYEWHNYGKSSIGNRSDIERVPIDRLRAFYHKYYRPDNAVLIIGGRFNEAKALEYIVKYFGPLKNPSQPLDQTYTDEPPQDGERSVVLRRVGKVGLVSLMYHIPAAAHPDYAAVDILSDILTSEPAGRLSQALVQSKKASRISGNTYAMHDPGIFEITAETEPGNLEQLQANLIRLVEDPARHHFTEEEVERYKRQSLNGWERQARDANGMATTLAEYAAQGDWRLFFIDRDRLKKVTVKAVDRAANKYLVARNRTLGVYIPTEKPERAEIPATPSIAEMVKDYKGDQAIAAGEAFDPTPANLDQRVQVSQLAIGAKLALLPKKTRGESVVAQMTLRYGNEQSLHGRTSPTQLLGPMLTRGTKKHTRQQIQDELNRLQATIQASGGVGAVNISVQAKRKTFPEVLNLLREILREPAFPPEEFEVLKRQFHDSLKRQLTEPTALALRDCQRRLSPYPSDNIRYVPTLQESMARLDAVSLEDMTKLYTDQLGAQAADIAVVGDFDPATVKEALTSMLEGWKSQTPYERISQPALVDVPGSRQQINTPDKANAVLVAGEMIALRDDDPDYPAMEVANTIFGGGTLSSRLGNRVRQKEGLSYGVGSQFSADAHDKSSRFFMFGMSNPANIGRMDHAISEELDRFLKAGPTAEEIAEAKKAYLESEKESRGSDRRLVGVLVGHLFDGRTFAYEAGVEQKVEKLTAEEVGAAFRRQVNPKRLIIVLAGDLKADK